MKIFITMPKTVQTESFLTPIARKQLEKLGEVTQNPYDRNLTKEELIELAADAEILFTGWSTAFLEKKDVERLPKLRMIAHTGGTVGNLIAQDVYETGVAVLSGNDVYAQSVAEGCLCYILSSLRRIEHYSGVMRTGGWREDNFQNRGLIGKKVGIVGFGTISKHFLELIRWFRCEILIYSSHLSDEEAAKYGGKTASLEEIFSKCDVVSFHTAVTSKTTGMITRELLERLKADALLVNTSRGSIIDENALFDLLIKGRFYAALDVYAEEPPRPDNPIRQCERAFLMPHMGGPTIDMREVVVQELCKDIVRFQNGEALMYEIGAAAAARMSRGAT